MPFSLRVVIGLLNLCLMVYISLLGASPACDDISEEPCSIRMTLRNFRLILSWELTNKSITPSHYTLWETIMSKQEDLKIVENCTNITRPFCDLTDVWREMHENYISVLEVYRENSMLFCCGRSILATHIDLEPPEFEIIGLTDHISVTVEFPPVTPKLYGKEMQYSISLVIKHLSEGVFNVHKPKIPRDLHGNFTYDIANLIPNTNHCISVYFDGSHVGRPIEPPLKCTLLHLEKESGSSDSTIIGGIIPGFLIPVVFIIIFLILKRIGYICLKHNFPKVLVCSSHFFLSF